MDGAATAAPVLDAAAVHLGRPIVPAARGGASDASHLATVVPLTIDGLGPLGTGSHAAHEHALASSFLPRTEVALALLAAILEATNR
jgi:glutamate carboxypeptidase